MRADTHNASIRFEPRPSAVVPSANSVNSSMRRHRQSDRPGINAITIAVNALAMILAAILMFMVEAALERALLVVIILACGAVTIWLWRSRPGYPGRPGHRAQSPHNSASSAARLSDEQQRLRTQLAEQQIIQESMSSGLIALDSQQRIININRAAARLLGVGALTSRGCALRDVTVEPELKRFLADALDRQSRHIADLELHGLLGATVQAIAEPLRADPHEPPGLLILLNDVTRMRKLESMRSDFAANVSHELRTPITNIAGYVETLIDVGVQDSEQAMRFLHIIKRNTDRLTAIIEDLLALARLERPESAAALAHHAAPVRRIAESAIAQFDSARADKRISIRLDVPADLMMFANEQLIEQALGNLLSNAIKYSPPETTVTVSGVARDDRHVEIAVSDQGPGIAPRDLPRLFERFYRVDKARSRELGGTGLGLAIVKHIAHVHGGRAEVESVVGQGSTFRLILPRDGREIHRGGAESQINRGGVAQG